VCRLSRWDSYEEGTGEAQRQDGDKECARVSVRSSLGCYSTSGQFFLPAHGLYTAVSMTVVLVPGTSTVSAPVAPSFCQ
jgi:hypothetical protein